MKDHSKESENRFTKEKGYVPHHKGDGMRFEEHRKALKLHESIFHSGDHASMWAYHLKSKRQG
jgi:hypothetical protein